MSVQTWIMWLVLFGNLWNAEGFQYQLHPPNAGYWCHPQTNECRLVLASYAPRR